MVRPGTLEFDAVLSDLARVLHAVSRAETEALVQGLLQAPAVQVAGSGRSGLVARAFAVRLAHLGMTVSAAGDPVSPALRRDDLLFMVSSTGRAATALVAAERAVEAGGRVVLVTSSVVSPLARLAHQKVILNPVLLPAPQTGPLREPPDPADVMLPMRTLFEQAAFLYLDVVVLRLMKATGQGPEDLEARLHNLD